ncbi:MAG TPA: deoxyribose-phosphate aldolase [Vicinamibacteria bacterium]|nr:deoxyribose-phosphate aldolase [Vicinamibacteria bacterium]
MTSPTPVVARWDVEAYLPAAVLDEITDVRIEHPRWVMKEARRRKRRKTLAPDGRLVLAAVDHPARGVNEIRGDALAMGDRHQYLARARRVLDDPDLDGIMATPDILEELLILSHLERKKKGKGFLDGRVIVGSMNRGGLAGTAFEMDDTFTSMSAARIAELGFDGGKMMYRLDPQDPASGRTIQACAQALNDLRKHGLPGFLEPLGVARETKGYVPAKDAATLVRQCGIAAGLGESSVHLWLKVPIVDDLARVCRATTLPLLLLGGPARGTAEETLRDFATALAAGARIRGAIIGRNLLYPGDADPLPLSRALTSLVHRGASLPDALQHLAEAARPRRKSAAGRG